MAITGSCYGGSYLLFRIPHKWRTYRILVCMATLFFFSRIFLVVVAAPVWTTCIPKHILESLAPHCKRMPWIFVACVAWACSSKSLWPIKKLCYIATRKPMSKCMPRYLTLSFVPSVLATLLLGASSNQMRLLAESFWSSAPREWVFPLHTTSWLSLWQPVWLFRSG